MTAEPDPGPQLDFSDLAILRASLAAIVVGPALLQSLSSVATGVWFSLNAADLSHLLDALATLPDSLLYLLNPAVMVMSFGLMGVMLFVGFFVMAAYKGDHTTWKAAAVIGMRTAAIGMALPLMIAVFMGLAVMLSGRDRAFEELLTMVGWAGGATIPVLGIGALTGLAARAAAGAPTLTPARPIPESGVHLR